MALRRRRAAPALDSGTTLGAYRIERLIGRGGMGAVYLAVDLRLNRVVALKILSPELSLDPAFRERFRREAVAQAALDHPHVVPVYDTGEHRGYSFIAMRYVAGETLKDLLARDPPEAAEVVSLLGQVADALEAAHEAGMVHRDVKPQNILIEQGTAFLADFGLTKVRGAGDLTNTGHQLGTIDYMSPEQFRNEPPTASTDIYSLAAVLYECLVGEVPFPRGSDVAVMYAHLEDPVPPLGADLPERLDALVRAAMSKNSKDRPSSANRFVADAADVLGVVVAPVLRRGRPALPSEPATPVRVARRSRARLVVTSVVVAAGIGAGVATSAIHTNRNHAPAAAKPVSHRITIGPTDVDVPMTWRVRRASATAVSFALNAANILTVHTAPNAKAEIDALRQPRRANVSVSSHQGELYESRGVAVYVFPLQSRDVIATCRTALRFRAMCEAMVGTMRIHSPGLAAAPRDTYLRRVNEILTRLSRDRSRLRRSLKSASTINAQASAADALNTRFATAAIAVGNVHERDVSASSSTALRSSLSTVANAYAELAAAARSSDESGYSTARAHVSSTEHKANLAAARLRVR